VLDFHNHLIPGVDDGAASTEEALTGVSRMVAQGIKHVITTPHFRASSVNRRDLFAEHMGRIDESWSSFQLQVRESFPEVKLERGVELALDEPLESVEEPKIRLAGSQFILVEFPYFTIPPNSVRAVASLVALGVRPIIAHPERYENCPTETPLLEEWKDEGALLQLNAGSLIGAYGRRPQRLGWRLLQLGLGDYLCTDYHARGTCLLAPAQRMLSSRGGDGQFQHLVTMNGMRLGEGLRPLPVPPLSEKKTLWQRIVRRRGF
jgi:protein-tyrosine phosphatase